MDEPSFSSRVLPLPVVQRHFRPFAAGLTVHVPQSDHQHHPQSSRAAQKHAQLPGTVSGIDVWNVPFLSWRSGWIGGGAWAIICVGGLWFYVVNICLKVGVKVWVGFRVWVNHRGRCECAEVGLRFRRSCGVQDERPLVFGELLVGHRGRGGREGLRKRATGNLRRFWMR